MSKQLKILLRVKELKEEQAFRMVNVKRLEKEKAKKEEERAQKVVEESQSTLTKREDAVYDAILGDVVPLDELDIRKGMVLSILKSHEELVDEKERAKHIHARADTELVEARATHHKSIRDRDKYVMIVEEVRKEIEEEEGRKEENEVEDQFIATHLLRERSAS